MRADRLLVERGLAANEEEAARLILAGRVRAGIRRVDKPGTLVEESAELRVDLPDRFVSRGGEKLAAALAGFAVAVEGRCCLDAGASTGGFTDCLLQRGAACVHAVDVGYGQLAWKLRVDPRVVVHERTNVRALRRDALVPPPDLVVADLSFVSLRSLLPVLAELAGPAGELVVLVKPQFELGREQVEGGVVRDPQARRRAVEAVAERARQIGLSVRGCLPSPLLGPAGNEEFFLHLTGHQNNIGCSR